MDLFRKKYKVGPKNLIRFYIALNLGESSSFIFGQFPVARKLIINGGAIRPTGLLLGINWAVYHRQLDIISVA